MNLTRRHFLRQAAAAGAAFAGLRTLVGCSTAPTGPQMAPNLVPDAFNIMHLPKGFKYQLISRSGERMDDGFLVPGAHDGMATFPGPNGATILVRNHELRPDELSQGSPFGPRNVLYPKIDPKMMFDAGKGKAPAIGGTTTIVYDTKNQIVERHYLSLAGTWRNCSGGPTPWGSWVTCEETVQVAKDNVEKDHGWCFEVPAKAEVGLAAPVPLKAMGRFNHEAIAVDPKTNIVYLTEDRGEPRDYMPEEYIGQQKPKPKPEDLGGGMLYRYIPESPGQLAKGGKLQALKVRDTNALLTTNWAATTVAVGQSLEVDWIDLENVGAPKDELRHQGRARGGTVFTRAEGIWYGNNAFYFCCTDGGPGFKGQIWRYVPSPEEGKAGEKQHPGRIELFVEPRDKTIMDMCDNLTVAPWGDLVVCEDGPLGNYLLGVTREGRVYKIAQVGMNKSELCGCCFSPDGSTLFVNIQRPGMTVAITGPLAKLSEPIAGADAH